MVSSIALRTPLNKTLDGVLSSPFPSSKMKETMIKMNKLPDSCTKGMPEISTIRQYQVRLILLTVEHQYFRSSEAFRISRVIQ